jgi:GGDEF domain-containing protein
MADRLETTEEAPVNPEEPRAFPSETAEQLKKLQTPFGGVLIGGAAVTSVFVGAPGDVASVVAASVGALMLAGSLFKRLPGGFGETNANPLKHMLTRERFEKEVLWLLLRKESSGGLMVAMQLDDLKLLNELYGHASGDLALVRYSEKMQEALGPEALVARSLGDEFVAFLPGRSELDPATVDELKSPPRQFSLGASIGSAPLRLPVRFTNRNSDDRKDAAIVALKTAIVEARTAMRTDADLRPSRGSQRDLMRPALRPAVGVDGDLDDERPGFERLRKLQEADVVEHAQQSVPREPLQLLRRRAPAASPLVEPSDETRPAPATVAEAAPASEAVAVSALVVAAEAALAVPAPPPIPAEEPPALAVSALDIAEPTVVEMPSAEPGQHEQFDWLPTEDEAPSYLLDAEALDAPLADQDLVEDDDRAREDTDGLLAVAEGEWPEFSELPAAPVDLSFPPLVKVPDERPAPAEEAHSSDFRLTPGSWLRR